MGHDIIKKRDGSQNWHLDITFNGLRLRDSLRTPDEKVARAMATQIHADALLGRFKNVKPEMTLDAGFTRYWSEQIEGLVFARHFRIMALVILDFFGKDKLLSEITEAELITYAKSRQNGQKRYASGKVRKYSRAPSTINAELRLVHTLCRRARRLWKVNAADLSMEDVLLREPDKRQRFLSIDEEEHLFQVLRPDMHAMVRFALITGLRVSNILTLTWDQVKWEERLIECHIKSKMPGGKVHFLPITKSVAAILSAELGRHPEFVFTLICGRTCTLPDGSRQVMGQRYPVYAYNRGWRHIWNKALKAAGLRHEKSDQRDFRFHDLRHTAATRLLKATRGNLKLVQRLLGHDDLTTTLRYAHTITEDLVEGMDDVDEMMASHRRPKLVRKQG
jgi:integrase